MTQPFMGQEISFSINEDQSELAFTVHGVGTDSTVAAASTLGSRFAYSVLGVNPDCCRSNGGQVNEDGTVTAKFRV